MKLIRKMSEEEKKNTRQAAGVGFGFYAIALSIHSGYILFTNWKLNTSFYILILGICVFFTSEYIINKKNK